jgi:hypothetical protein
MPLEPPVIKIAMEWVLTGVKNALDKCRGASGGRRLAQCGSRGSP